MTQPVSISLITQDSSLLGKTRVTVLETLLGTQMTLWPAGGVEWDKNSEFQNTKEFWVTPEAKGCIVLRFGDKEVFKVTEHLSIQTWGWYLKWAFPNANVRFLPPSDTLPDISSEKQDRQSVFKLAMLETFFHDMKYCKNKSICRNAAKWLASLKNPILKPFEFIQDRRHWEDWYLAGSGSQFRRTRVNIFPDVVQNNVIKDNSQFFWEQICLLYQKWARDELSEQEYRDLGTKLVKLTNKW